MYNLGQGSENLRYLINLTQVKNNKVLTIDVQQLVGIIENPEKKYIYV